jgi:LacI family transcriptional regulator
MKRVAILAETALDSGRAILGGVARYLHERDDWSVFHHTGPLGAMEPASLEQWEGDGIIARLANPELLALARAKGVPVVDVMGNAARSPFPLVKCDDRRIGALAAEHLLESGHRHFAFVGLSDERWSLEREEAFSRAAEDSAASRLAFHLTPGDRGTGAWPSTLERVAQWLATAPRPLGLMVASDQFGPLVLEACNRLRLAVPEEIAVVSVDNDLPFCNLCQPRLSSIEPDHAQIGYLAARLLDQLMEGRPAESPLLEVPPLTLHRRRSSDSTAVSDPALVRALQYIRRCACEGISVDDVARHAGLSRSVLQRRFRAQLRRTVGETLLQTRLSRACDILSFTDLPLIDVAERSGFKYQEYLSQVFKRHLHTTPARYRRRSRHDSSPSIP